MMETILVLVNKYRTALVALCLMTISAGIGWLVAQGSFNMVIYAILTLIAVAIILTSPYVALGALILIVFSFESLVSMGWIPVVGLWTIDVLVAVLFSRVFLMRGHTSGYLFRSPVLVAILIWSAMMLFSGIAGTTNFVQVTLGLRAYVRFILLFIAILQMKWDLRILKRYFIFLALLFLTQVPVVILQRVQGLRADAVTGTLGGGMTGVLSFMAMVFFAGISAYSFLSNRKGWFFAALPLLSIPAFASARAYIFIIPLLLVYLTWRISHWRIKPEIIIMAMILLLLLMNWDSMQGLQAFRGFQVLDVIKNPLVVMEELNTGPVEGTMGGSIGRITAVSLAWEQISQSFPTILFGYGPGSATGSRFSALQSDMYEVLALLGARVSQLPRSLLEWGMLGTISFSGIYIMMWRRAERLFRILKDPFWKSIAFAYSFLILLAFSLIAYTAVWLSTLPAFLFWFTGAILEWIMLKSEEKG